MAKCCDLTVVSPALSSGVVWQAYAVDEASDNDSKT